jgi:hypothetical protein
MPEFNQGSMLDDAFCDGEEISSPFGSPFGGEDDPRNEPREPAPPGHVRTYRTRGCTEPGGGIVPIHTWGLDRVGDVEPQTAPSFGADGWWWWHFGRRAGLPYRSRRRFGRRWGWPGAFGRYQPSFGDDADTSALRLYALDLLGSLKRAGVSQNATRSIRQFALAWNAAQSDQPIAADGKYTRETQAALDAALQALAPGQGSAPTAIL